MGRSFGALVFVHGCEAFQLILVLFIASFLYTCVEME